jgi:transcriptional regulator with XRE-family HTH domain
MKTKDCKENDQITTGHFHRSLSGEEKDLSERLSECPDGEPVATFARRAGIGESTLRNILKGASPRADHLTAIAFAAGVTLDWLTTGQGVKSAEELRRLTKGKCAATPDVAVATPDVAPGMQKYAARLEAIMKLLEDIEDEGEREVLLADFFARAQNAKQIDELKRTVADLRAAQQKTG